MNAIADPATNETMSVRDFPIWRGSAAPEPNAEDRSERQAGETELPGDRAAEDLGIEVYGY